MSEELKGLRADRIAVIDHRKQVDSDLQKLNKEKIPVMARNLSRLEPTLYYKNDDRINEAIRENFPPQKLPFGDEICLCNTLIHYLNRFVSNTDLDPNPPEVRVTFAEPSDSAPVSKEESAGQACGPTELDDGQYVLLQKPKESYVPRSPKFCRKHRRCRKQSAVKRITHTPEVLSQFSQLNLQAPASAGEVLASLEQLNARKLYYEREAEVRSEAELSVTESAIHEMSRQASHTESSDEVTESNPGDSVVEQLLERADLRDNAAEGQTPDKLALPEWDCFRNWHSAKEKQPSDAETLTPPSDLDEPQPRTRN
nr:hypothetical protein BaRGS_026002 [Batillaria attramentaria]